MYKKTITYTDYDGNECTEDLYFNFSRAELVEMETSIPGGMSAYIESMINSHNTAEIMATFKTIILSAYGIKSPDGKRFIKNDQVREEFEQSPAYDEFLMGIIMDTDEMVKFVNSIIPNVPMAKQAQKGTVYDLKEAARKALDKQQNS